MVGVLQNHINATTPLILSAFQRDTIPGSIYVEAHALADVKMALRGVSGVLYSNHKVPRVEPVSLVDRVPLLDMLMGGMSESIQAESWVRVKSGKTYRDDLGLVIEMDSCTNIAVVLLVPRIQMDRKRKRNGPNRPSAALFDPDAVKKVFGTNAIERRTEQMWTFKDTLYKNGLVEKEIHLSGLSDRPNATQYELDFFHSSQDPFVMQALQQTSISLRIGDKIRVLVGELKGLQGELTDIKGDNTLVFTSDDGRNDIQVPASDARKHFSPGESVRVLHGRHKGEEGYIVHLRDYTATVVKRVFVSHKGPNAEVLGAEVYSVGL